MGEHPLAPSLDLYIKTKSMMLPVEIRGSRAGNLLLALSHIEEHGLVWLWPLEVKAFLDAVSCEGPEHLVRFLVFEGAGLFTC